ncbi:hypothetical protein DOZ69_20155 [Pseudomonas fluorescens]|nr:hypothetical protein DOZ69_20155 [Pseudomonas fluorescens]
MKELSYCYPWLITEVLNPLLEQEKTKIEFVADVWLNELLSLINKLTKNQNPLFQLDHQAKTTDIAAFLMANSNADYQKEVYILLEKKLRNLRAKIQQPLASTTNWTDWDNHLKASFWISGYLKWITYYLSVDSEAKPALEQASLLAVEICSGRSLNDWRRLDYSGGQYSIFLDDRPALPQSKP